MKLSPTSYFCLGLILVGFIRAIQLYYSSTRDLRVANQDDNWYQEQQRQKIKPAELQHAGYRNSTGRMANQPDQIFYFIQVSDLHISKFQPKGHTIHFLHFLQSALPTIDPEFVVVTGDLIDAKDETRTVSAQYLEEWQVYKSAVEQGANGTTWYDMRGNHDCFDLVSWKAENNLYRQFGKSSKILDDGKGVYSWQVSKAFGNYNFVAVDSCPRKGPSRPFNFFGYLTTNSMNRLVSKIMPTSFNHTFLFSHYPTTTMFPGVSSEGYRFKDLANHFSIYFCGHLHKLAAGLGEVLKTYRRQSDSLELEVADMKDHGAYRIVAVDHDLISFIDVELPVAQIPPVASDIVPLTQDNKVIWPDKIYLAPIVLITNPKDSRYTLPTKEPLHESRLSSHIRLLIFSEFAPDSLKIQTSVDNKRHAYPAEFIGSISHENNMPLWAIMWDPIDFDDFETHYLRVQVTAPDGQVGIHEIPFRMDNMRVKIQGGTGEWIIWASISSLVRFLSIFAVTAMLITITAPKIYNDYEKNQQMDAARHTLRNKILLLIHEIDVGINQGIYSGIQKHLLIWVHRILQFPEEQPYVWSLCFACLLSLLTLPWFRAEFIPSGKDEHQGMGFFYLWGLLFENHQWIPLDTWMFAIFQLTFNVGVFILYFIWKSSSAHQLQCKGTGQAPSRLVCDRLWLQIFVLIYWLWRLHGLWDLATFYGGVYPTLVFNLLVWWLLGVVAVILIGKNGLYDYIKNYHNQQQSEPVGVALEICPSCIDAVGGGENPADNFFVATAGQDEEQHTNIQEESRRILFDGDGSDSSSSSKTTNRPFRRNATKKD